MAVEQAVSFGSEKRLSKTGARVREVSMSGTTIRERARFFLVLVTDIRTSEAAGCCVC